MRILCVEANTPGRVAGGESGAAAFLRTFEELGRAVQARVVNPFEQDVTRNAFDGVDGIVFTGSGEKWCVDAPEVVAHRRAMELALEAGLPIWGSCNGMQLAALVLGSASSESPNGMEIGVAQEIQLTEAGAAHPMMDSRASGFAVPCIHRDSVVGVPKGITLLAYNAHTPVQAFAWSDGRTDVWATQYHPELGPADIAGFIRARGIFENATQFLADLDAAAETSSAATRLGARPEDMMLMRRACELRNWLDLVAARIAERRAA